MDKKILFVMQHLGTVCPLEKTVHRESVDTQDQVGQSVPVAGR